MPPKRDPSRHAAVLDAAIQLIREKGLDGTSIQDIADAVGIKKGSMNNYFSSKAELAELIQERFTVLATDALDEIVARTDLGPEEKLRALLRFHAEHSAVRMSSPILTSFMQLWAPIDSELGKRQLKIRRRYESAFKDQLCECQRQGLIRDVDVELLSHTMVGAMSWTAFWYNRKRHGPLDAVVDSLVDMWFEGLRRRPRPARSRS